LGAEPLLRVRYSQVEPWKYKQIKTKNWLHFPIQQISQNTYKTICKLYFTYTASRHALYQHNLLTAQTRSRPASQRTKADWLWTDTCHDSRGRGGSEDALTLAAYQSTLMMSVIEQDAADTNNGRVLHQLQAVFLSNF